jgi:acyl-coenzyme A synthetase/AMP-(fatty) acid ligase
MLACARIGATHSVVFGGFSSEALRDRMNDAQAQGRSSPPTAATGAGRWCR